MTGDRSAAAVTDNDGLGLALFRPANQIERGFPAFIEREALSPAESRARVLEALRRRYAV